MDVSFEPTMNGGGWGADVGNVSMSQAPTVSGAQTEKVPLPVRLSDISGYSTTDDKYRIKNFSFSNIRVCGSVETIEDNMGERTLTLSDPIDKGSDKRFTVIVYESVQSKITEPYAEGDVVIVLGKLRSFDGAISLLAFNLSPVREESHIRFFHVESELAHVYYEREIVDRVSSSDKAAEISETIFNNRPPEKAKSGTAHGFSQAVPAAKIEASNSNSRNLSGLQAKIINVLENSNSEAGVHVDAIIKVIGGDSKDFRDHLQYLLNEGIIYTTLDDDHYSAL